MLKYVVAMNGLKGFACLLKEREVLILIGC